MDASDAKEIKCVIWDLDHTVWHGVLLEDEEVTLRPGVREVLEALDARGILLSIASRNDPDQALARLRAFDLDQFFLYPQIGWGAKSESVRTIQEQLNIGIDTLAFVDDQPFERDEVRFACPEVLCVDAAELSEIPAHPRMNPRFITDDSRKRRQMYQADIDRNTEEKSFVGPQEEFLASLDMTFSIQRASRDDLQRAEELTVRTNQLNTTGYTYSYDELDELRRSPGHLLLIASLDDKYGSYGKIGLVLVEKGPALWNIRLLLMSCRVMSRGVGGLLINHVRSLAADAGVELQAEMITTDRNRMMLMTYRFMGFSEADKNDAHVLLKGPPGPVPEPPAYVQINTEGSCTDG
jgi:FkbH-like protein